jgi:outer membrane biogenesis lipoprotein LolB
MTKQFKFSLSVLLLCVGLHHCAATSTQSCQALSPEVREAHLSHLTHWQWTGHVIFPDPKGGRQRLHVLWRQQGDHYHIVFSSDWGLMTATLDGSPAGMRLRSTGHKEEHHHSIQPLIQSFFHVSIPFAKLKAWFKGQVNQRDGLQRNAQGLPEQLNRLDLQVNWRDYHCVSGFMLPYHMTLKHEGGTVSLFMQTWQLNID